MHHGPDKIAAGLESCFAVSIKTPQKPYIIESLGPKALKYEFFEGRGRCLGFRGLRACEKDSAGLAAHRIEIGFTRGLGFRV